MYRGFQVRCCTKNTHAHTKRAKFKSDYCSYRLKFVYSYRSMPLPYSLDLRWRIVWVYLTQNLSQSRIGLLFSISDRTVGRVISLFNQTGDVKPRSRRNGPICVMQDFEQLSLVQLIITHPGIYLHEIQEKLLQMGIIVSLSNICRTYKKMGVTRQAMLCNNQIMNELSIWQRYQCTTHPCWCLLTKQAAIAETQFVNMGIVSEGCQYRIDVY